MIGRETPALIAPSVGFWEGAGVLRTPAA